MKLVNLITGKNVKKTLFPDGAPHIDLQGIVEGDEVEVITRLRYANDVLYLLEVSDALNSLGCVKKSLEISYLMGARYDRSMRDGDSFDLRVISSMINLCQFERVFIFDVHSRVTLRLVHRSTNISNKSLVKLYDKPHAVLIVPDQGAQCRALNYLTWLPNLHAVVCCDKKRDLDTGKITLKVNNPERCTGRNCVIIDDICDGGATFIKIAEQIKPQHLTLVVSHGIFSKGLKPWLLHHFNEIITTDSYQYQNPRPGLKVLSLYEPDVTD